MRIVSGGFVKSEQRQFIPLSERFRQMKAANPAAVAKWDESARLHPKNLHSLSPLPWLPADAFVAPITLRATEFLKINEIDDQLVWF